MVFKYHIPACIQSHFMYVNYSPGVYQTYTASYGNTFPKHEVSLCMMFQKLEKVY